MKRIILVLITVILWFFSGIIVLAFEDWAKADEETFAGDSDYQELQIDATDQLILDARLKYYWDEVYQGTSTIGHKTVITAHVN